MAKYNLLDDDDIFAEDDENQPSQKNPEPPLDQEEESISFTPEQSNDMDIDDDLLGINHTTNLDDPDFNTAGDLPEITINDEQAEASPSEQQDDSQGHLFDSYDEQEKEETAPAKEKSYIESPSYEDEKQEGPNYKPIIIGAIIIVILLGGYFVVDKLILNNSSNTTTNIDQPVKSAEEIRQEQELEKKKQFLKNLAAQTEADVDLVNNVLQYTQKETKLSSVLLYDNSFSFEIFGKNRADIARANMRLKSNMTNDDIKVIASTTRPGSNGGIFGLFKIDTKQTPASTRDIQPRFKSPAEVENWLQTTSTGSNMKVNGIKNSFLKDESPFKAYEVDASFSGSLTDCQKFLQKLATEGSHVRIHKMNLIAGDQRTFQAKNYKLRLILNVYV